MKPPPPKHEHLLVVLPWEEPVEQLERIRKEHAYIQVTYHRLPYKGSYWQGDLDLAPEIFHSATMLATLHSLPPNPPTDCPHLKLIHFISAGVDHIINHPIYRHTDITLTTSSGIHGPQMAEWVLLTALAFSHRFPLLLDWQRRRHWGGLDDLGFVRDMIGQRLAVLGYGAIGRQVARVGKAMGMDVIAFTASPRPTPESRRDNGYIVPGTGDPDGSIPSAWYSGLTRRELHHFLAQDVDILLISVPLTPVTTHLLGKDEFEILGRRRRGGEGAFVSNISRGQVIQQDDLVDALKPRPTTDGEADQKESLLRGAALDVTDPEPLPDDHELWTLPNVFITPHISGAGAAYVERAFQVLEENLKRLESGSSREGLINVVDRKRGY